MADPVLSTKALRIGLIGTYDVENYGDCLFPEVYAHCLRQRFPNAHLTLYSPFARAARVSSFDSALPLPAQPEGAAFADDVLILTGGETMAVGHTMGTYMLPADTLSHYLRMWLVPSILNGSGDIRFFAHSVGVPPSLTHMLGPAARVLQSAERMSARDTVSAQHLACEIDVDPVFLLPEILSQKEWQARAAAQLPDGVAPGEYIACQISPIYAQGADIAWCEQVIAVLRKTGAKAVFLPVCHFLHDYQYMQHARRKIADIAPDISDHLFELPTDVRNVKDTAALIAASRGLIGSSLHAGVTAAAFARPMAVFAGDGGAKGKHQNTMLAAGFDTGIALDINAIAGVFAQCELSDLNGQRGIARQRAHDGFNQLCQAIADPARKTTPVQQADIEELRRFDRAPIAAASQLRGIARKAIRRLPALQSARRRISFRHRLEL